MSEFRIKSVESDLEMILSDIKGDYFKVRVVSAHLNAIREVWAYTDASGLADFMEHLASHEKPWAGTEHWESLEGEFKFSAKCSLLGRVTFEIELSHEGCAEEWLVRTQLSSELGQLPKLAKSARAFFGEAPS